MRVRCWSEALLSSSADWARLRKPKILHGYNTPQSGSMCSARQETHNVNICVASMMSLQSISGSNKAVWKSQMTTRESRMDVCETYGFSKHQNVLSSGNIHILLTLNVLSFYEGNT